MAFLGDFGNAINSGAESLGGQFGLTKNASRNAFLGFISGGLPGAVAGAASGPVSNFFTGADAKNAALDAQKEADRTRRKSVVRQMGAREQADSIAMAGLRSTGMGAGQGSFLSNTGSQSSGSSTSGTF